MYLTEGIGAAATARPNPRPRSRPRLISTSRQIQRPEALRCAPLDTFLQVRAMHGIAGLTRRAFRSILALFHHLLSDVLAYWRWYGERAAGIALPEIYQQFVQKIASSKVLQRLCSDQLHELKWRHALREQLGAMWEQFRYPQPPSRNRRTGGGRERLAGATHPAHTATPSEAYSGSDRLNAV